MRTVVILALGVVVLAALGIVHFRKQGDRVDVSIDTAKLEDKAEGLIDAVKDRVSDDNSMRDRDESPIESAFDRLGGRVRDARETVDDFAGDVEDHVRDARRRIEK